MKLSFQNKYILTLALSIFLLQEIWACGCYTYDYNSIQTNSYLGLFYNQRFHQGYNQTLSSPSLNSLHRISSSEGTIVETKNDYERFQFAELRYNQNIKDWLNLTLVLPFVHNQDYYETIYYSDGTIGDASHNESGIGDIFIAAMFVTQKEREVADHTFKYGAGIYLPTGNHKVVDENGEFIDPSHQPGRGTVNYLLQFRHFMILNDRYGLSSSFNYLFNSKGKKYPSTQNYAIQYTYGNQFTAYSDFFYKIFIDEVDLVPKLGMYYENIQKDLLNDFEQKDTGGNLLYVDSGLDFKVKDLTIQSTIRIPVWQELNGLQQETKWILNLGMIYAF